MKRLYILTGKGGVGKTALSLALTSYLSHVKNKKARYLSFNNEVSPDVLRHLELDYIELSLERSTEIYIGKKLNSKTIASWIMKTPFFKALYNMLPSLGQMVTLGHILDQLKDDPELTIVLDSPASGHALSMFESTHNFKKIFGQGPIVKDIEKMHELLYSQEFLKTFIVALPTVMAAQEALELQKHLQELNFKQVEVLVNECLSANKSLEQFAPELPPFIVQKIELEQEIVKSHTGYASLKTFPHIFSNQIDSITKGLQDYMEDLL